MPLDFLAVGASPVPGYELQQPLGGSAFSSIWTVKAPDGSPRLWKIIDLVVANTALETRHLELLVRLKHPSLNPLLEYHTIPDKKCLILETAAPQKSLRDRLKECKYYTPPAVPSHELGPWLMSVAEGLDFLNSPQHEFQGKCVSIFHRELKPENMLLFREGNAIVCKVGDFGLAKPVSDHGGQHSQGLANYDYDPPEFYEGKTSSTCDQYSLAIACYELRTGSLPFSGSMLEQLSARLNDTPNLTAIESDDERAVIRKALLKHPDKRYRNCREFVAAWIDAMTAAELAKAPAQQESPSMRMRRSPIRAAAPASLPPPPVASLRATPKPNRRDLPEPMKLIESNGPGSAMKRIQRKAANADSAVTAQARETAVATAADGERSAIRARFMERMIQEDTENSPPESPSMYMKRKPSMTPMNMGPQSDGKVPMAWVFIISAVVLGAIAVFAKEMVMRARGESARAFDDQRHGSVIYQAHLHVGGESARFHGDSATL